MASVVMKKQDGLLFSVENLPNDAPVYCFKKKRYDDLKAVPTTVLR